MFSARSLGIGYADAAEPLAAIVGMHRRSQWRPASPVQHRKVARMYRSLLVPLDGSPFGEHALPLARAIARQTSATLHLVHVHVISVPISVDAFPVFDEALDAQDRAREQAYLDGLARRLSTGGELAVTTAVLDDPVASALQTYATAHAIGMVVMTTHGRGAFSRFWLGSVADTLVRCAPMPILLLRPHQTPPDLDKMPEMKHILVPLDGSAVAERILAPATALGALTDAAFTLLHVVTPEAASYETDWPTTRPEAGLLRTIQAGAHSYLARVAERLGAQSLGVHTAVLSGQTAPAILEYAHSHAVDLIALATHGRNRAARVLLGSIADKIVRGATTPVLLHRPPKDALEA
jgi:nucleotide-binding universal stress UspA family protein